MLSVDERGEVCHHDDDHALMFNKVTVKQSYQR